MTDTFQTPRGRFSPSEPSADRSDRIKIYPRGTVEPKRGTFAPAEAKRAFIPTEQVEASETRGAVGELFSPFTDYPEIYHKIVKESTAGLGKAFDGLFQGETMAEKALHGLEFFGEAGRFLVSPIDAAARSFAGRPIGRNVERTTGLKGSAHTIEDLVGESASLAAQFLLNPEGNLLKYVGKGARALRKSVAGRAVEEAVSPTTISAESERMERVLNRFNGRFSRATAIASNNVERFRGQINRLPFNQRQRMIQSIETGLPHPIVGVQPVVSRLRGMIGAAEMRVLSVGRKIPNITPLTTDPIEYAVKKIYGLDKTYFSTVIADEIKNSGVARLVPHGAPGPIGWSKLEGDIFETDRFRGIWHAPEEAARVYNRFVSEGLRGNKIYDSIRQAGNGINNLQLGLSFFHALFTSHDTMVSRLALGIENAVHKEFGAAAKNITTSFSPGTPFFTMRKGGKLLSAYLDPRGATPQMRQIVKALMDSGGRISMDEFYAPVEGAGLIKSLWNHGLQRSLADEFRTSPYKTILKAPFKIAGMALKDVGTPIMEWLVPRQKLGVFYDLADTWIKRNPHANPVEFQNEMIKIWDSVDNRLGQMVYDRLFWNKTSKDLAFIAARSVGWNLGTVRELGGGAMDAARAISHLGLGEEAEFTHRMAYSIAMPVMAAYWGATISYLYTGHGPKDIKDYFFPRTGKLTPQGDEERLNVPSYIKDVLEYNQDPYRTVANKIHPLWSIPIQIMKNEDFYDGVIHDPHAPGWDQMNQYFDYLLGAGQPFGIRAARKSMKEGGGVGQAIGSVIGLQPAPTFITAPERVKAYEERELIKKLRKKAREQ